MLTSVTSVWRTVVSSSEVPDSGVLTIEIDGEEVVLWRSASGVLAACDPRCPHQLAHLGAVGAVDGEELVCLSHFWRFRADGGGSKVAMNGRRDEKGPILSHQVREIDGRIELSMTAE
jgi:phenylpropionate dioxygenase-like ring-hydroxylating dioxygenase large terminal subunit